jgi:hypothetical protein
MPADLATGIPDGWGGLDAGPKSIELYRQAILSSKTIIWNGPAGVFEFEKFAGATKAMAAAIAEATENGATTIVVGGHNATAATAVATHARPHRRRTNGEPTTELEAAARSVVLPTIATTANNAQGHAHVKATASLFLGRFRQSVFRITGITAASWEGLTDRGR